MAKEGTVVIESNICNITEKIGSSKYTSLGGYTANFDRSSYHFVVMRESDSDAELVEISYSPVGSYVSTSDQRNVGHGNDCTYYDGNYYIAQGKGKSGNTESLINRTVKCFDDDFKYLGTYEYYDNNKKNIDNITGITSLNNGFFLVGSGNKYAVCQLDREYNRLNWRWSVDLNDTEVEAMKKRSGRSGLTASGQGIYCAQGKLYKVYTYRHDGDNTRKNDIAKFDLPGSSPSFSGEASLEKYYPCDRAATDKVTFEIEGVSSNNYGNTMYMAANVQETGTNEMRDSIYRITLK